MGIIIIFFKTPIDNNNHYYQYFLDAIENEIHYLKSDSKFYEREEAK